MAYLDRRDFLKGAATTAAAAGITCLAGCGREAGTGPYINTNQTFKYRMVTTWPPDFPVIGEGATRLAERLAAMSNGRLQIKVYGAGEKVVAAQAFDEVSMGNVEMAHSAGYYWSGKAAAAQFFAAVPFGMTAQQMNAWIYHGGGQELWDKVYAPHDLIAMPVGNTGVQMGGWFNREINSVADFRGLIMRMPGLGGKVLDMAGVTVSLPPPTELYSSLSTGVIDATEWVGPYHDYKMGLHKIAKFYYYPGWHEPGTTMELMFNRHAWEKLPGDLQAMVRAAAAQGNMDVLAELEAKNFMYLRKLVDEHKVQLRRFPDDVLRQLRKNTGEVLADLTSKDPLSSEVYASFSDFQRQVSSWAEVAEKAYFSS